MSLTQTFARIALASVLACCLGIVQAKELRVAAAQSIPGLDPHTFNTTLASAINRALYEALVVRDPKTYRISPLLASRWEPMKGNWIRFYLDSRATFHDGSSVTSEDVVFSIERAKMPESTFSIYTSGIEEVVARGPKVVDFKITHNMNVFLNQLTELRIMSKKWAIQHSVTRPLSLRNLNPSYHTYNHAMGTGPFVLSDWAEGKNIVLERRKNPWRKARGNVTTLRYLSIPDDGERMRAILSGKLDMVIDPPSEYLQLVGRYAGLRLSETFEARAIFVGFDYRSHALDSTSGGDNPLQSRLVRQALYQAIDIQRLKNGVLNGMATPTGSVIAPVVAGWHPDLNKRLPYSPTHAKILLDSAGYKNGFVLPLACPQGRYLNDKQVCEAIASMWSAVGIQVRLSFYRPNEYFAKLLDKSIRGAYLLGWTTATYDAHYTLSSLFEKNFSDTTRSSSYNVGLYYNAQLERLIALIETEQDLAKRLQLMQAAASILNQDIAVIPLYFQLAPRLFRKNISNLQRFDYSLFWADVVIK